MTSQPAPIEEHVITESRLISLNSKFATDFFNGDNKSSVSFDFNAIVRKDSRILYHTIAIQSAEIPASYYNVNESNNTINLTEAAQTFSVVIPPGNYDANSFIAAFILAHNALFTNDATLSFNATTGKFALMSDVNAVAIVMNLLNTTAQTLLGVNNDLHPTNTINFPYNAGNPTSMDRPANFLGVVKIKVSSNALAGDNYDSVSLNTSTLIDTISTTATTFGLTIYNSLGRESFVKAKRIDEIDIQLHDQDDNDINFNGADWNFTIILNSHRKQMFSNDDGVINFDKLEAFKEAVEKPEPLKKELEGLEVQEVKEVFREPEPIIDDFDDDVLLN
tara:strand:+ start:217 stop:1221 length:1005 start_codon:yes stop_codon:yes gene_type:complete